MIGGTGLEGGDRGEEVGGGSWKRRESSLQPAVRCRKTRVNVLMHPERHASTNTHMLR